MMSIFRRRARRPMNAEFCDGCGQVCTPQCRAQAQVERTQASVLAVGPFPR
jgi:hypothetical protein